MRPDTTDRRESSANASPAGRVLLIGLLALVLAALLNSQALLRDAQTKPLGWTRDVSLAVWEPVETVASAVGLHLPRLWLAQAMNREHTLASVGDDPADAAAPAPADDAPVDDDPVDDTDASASAPANTPADEPSNGAPSSAEPEPDTPSDDSPSVVLADEAPPGDDTAGGDDVSEQLVGTVDDPLRLLVLGDSLVHFFGDEMVRLANATGVINAATDSEISSGLSRPDYFNWPERLTEILAADDADVVVLMFGGNDAQGLVTSRGNVQPFSAAWKAEYASRVGVMMDIATREPRRQVLWVGLPPMQSDSFEDKMRELDAIYASEAAARERVHYVRTYELFEGPSGGYSRFVDVAGGQRIDARLSDGIHFSTAGGELLSRRLLEELDAVADLDGG